MNLIVRKKYLNDTICEMDIQAERIARKAKAGQFIILRVDDNGERIPLTIAGFDEKEGTVKIIFQIVGATTSILAEKNEGEYLSDFVGPLGNPTNVYGKNRVCVVGGGVGCAIALPVANALKNNNANVVSIIGFRTKDLVILEDEFKRCSDKNFVVTDDGTYGEKGNVCGPLKQLLESGETFDEIITIGPLVMMKFVVNLAKEYNVPCTVSMNPIMIDGTGMCGGCRLTVDGKQKFACVDGPDFDGYSVDFDEAMRRNRLYNKFEESQREKHCNLFKKEEK